MIDTTTTTTEPRSRRSTLVRRMAVTASAAMCLTLVPATAGAQSFLDPADPCPPGVAVQAVPFTDRDQILEVHRANVDCASALGIARGTQSGAYNPGSATDRGQMASFIVRSLQAGGYTLPAPTDQGFQDIAGNTHRDSINQLAAIGVTVGKTPTQYDPDAPVRRDQMASFVVRAAVWAYEGVDGPGFEPMSPTTFADVAPTNVHRDNIAVAMQILGLTEGTTPTTFSPANPTRRDQMATFLVRLVDMTFIEATPQR